MIMSIRQRKVKNKIVSKIFNPEILTTTYIIYAYTRSHDSQLHYKSVKQPISHSASSRLRLVEFHSANCVFLHVK